MGLPADRLSSRVINTRKIFWGLVVFELITMVVILFGDKITWAYFAGITLTPFLVIGIPIEPALGVVAMIVSTGFDFLGKIAEASDQSIIRLTYFHLAMVLTLFSVFLHLLLKKKIAIPVTSLWPPLLAFLSVMMISIIYSPDFDSGCFEVARMIFMALVTLVIMVLTNKKWRAYLILWTIILVPFLVSVLSIYQLLNEGSIFAPIVRKVATELGMPVYRSTGTFSNPNALGCFLMVGIIPAFALLFQKKQSLFLRILLITSIGVTGVALLISFSRGSWLSTLAGVLVVVLLHRKWSYIFYFLIGAVAVFVILAITQPVVVEAVYDRFGSIFDPSSDRSSSSRLSLIKSAIWMWEESPILGVGAGGFAYNSYEYMDPDMPEGMIWVKEAHTIQAKILAEQGLVGITVAVWLFFTILFHGIRTSKSLVDDFLKNAQIGLTSLFVGFIVNFTFASDPFNNMFWLSIGLLFAIPLIESMNPSEPAGEAVTVS
ncbi:O-antigen ligase family protein [bacterium]|nr:O-antigen ligase family protein [bacterium]